MSIDPVLYDAYFGANAAHIAFKREIVNAKVLFFQIQGSREHLRAYFDEKVVQARRDAPASFSIGMVTEVLSPTQFRGLNIPHNEAALVADDSSALEAQFHALLYADLQRIIESFLSDLFAEIARKDPRVLISNKTVTFGEVLNADSVLNLLLEKQLASLSRLDREGFEKHFNDMGLPIVPSAGSPPEEREFLLREFTLLWDLRNVLQHSHGVVDGEFLKKVRDSEYKSGDRVRIDVPRLGRAFAAVESIADDLNRRAIAKFGLT